MSLFVIIKENTGRFNAFISHIGRKYKTLSIEPVDFNIKVINEELEYWGLDKYIVVILGEADIKRWGEIIYKELSSDLRCEFLYPIGEFALLEQSKIYCRTFMNEFAKDWNPIWTLNNEWTDKKLVVKADGLASGKGVMVEDDHFDRQHIKQIIEDMTTKHSKILLEEKLEGTEFSLMSLCWKGRIVHAPCIRDFKRRYENDIGANTGGMGAISFPNGLIPSITKDDMERCRSLNMSVYNYFRNRNNYNGGLFLYGSFIKCNDGQIKLIEYNTRPGDSEFLNWLSLIDNIGDWILGFTDVLSYREAYSLSLYIVHRSYPNSGSGEFRLGIDMPIYEANAITTSRRNYYYKASGRLACLVLIDEDINRLLRLYNMYCSNIKGIDIDYRKDIIKHLIDYNHSYINHLDTYNEILDKTKPNIDNTNRDIAILRPSIKLVGSIGDFANSIEYNGMRIICSVDGAGTKTKFLTKPDKFRVLGQDVVIHNLNDMLVHRGTPIAFLDYFGSSRLNKNDFNDYISGILDICKAEGIPLIGGETAEMKDIYMRGEVEVLGILLGVNGISNGGHNNIPIGSYIYGIKSHGAHTNGFTKLRDLTNMPSQVRDYFSRPHRLYKPLIEKIDEYHNILGMAHITGGGFLENIIRCIEPEYRYLRYIDLDNWSEELDYPWRWVLDNSSLSWREFIRIFNAGYGFCFIINEPLHNDLLTTGEYRLIGRI